ncbi:MAG: FHA domain-containing protein [Thermoflexales bacterium]|nr:FHA domain-containing protein [Thermoflexales bacterium]MDW8351966.1 FHA domain-containing protein [Anaerolineae bacterium]
MLIIETGQLAGQRWLIDSDEVIIGREPGAADLILPERQVSRRHAKIERTPEGFLLSDLNSKNGTFVNGEPVKTARLLRDGDEIQIALCVKIAFVGSDATAPLVNPPIGGTVRPVARGIRIDKEARRVYVADREIAPPLSLHQYRLLELLVDANGSLIPRQDIVEWVWAGDTSYGVTEQALDALVRRLRERIAEFDPDHEYIVTVRGHGLRFENRRE